MASFTVNERGLEAMLDGPGARDLIRRADAVVALSKVYSPVRTGRLRSGNRRGPVERVGRLQRRCRVINQVPYAPAIHEGRESRFAPWSWRRHGPPPRRFLYNALSAAGGRVSRGR